MLTPQDRQRITAEANYALASLARRMAGNGKHGHWKDKIEEQPIELYKAPSFLDKTAPGMRAQLDELLYRLWEVNQEWAGEKVLEAHAYLTTTGEYLELEEAFREFAHRYFCLRADPQRVNPQVRNDPFELALKLEEKELNALFVNVGAPKYSIDAVFLARPVKYARWLLYDRLWKDLIVRVDADTITLNHRPPHPDNPSLMHDYIIEGGYWHDNRLEFLRRFSATLSGPLYENVARRSDDELQADLAVLAGQIEEIRPFLVNNFKPEKTICTCGADLAVAWTWTLAYGIAYIMGGFSERQVRIALVTGKSPLLLAVTHDGILVDPRMPWRAPLPAEAVGGFRPLVLNYMLLQLCFERLYSFYEKINFDRLRVGNTCPARDEPAPNVVAVSVRDLARKEEEHSAARDRTERIRPHLVPTLRRQRLVAILRDRLKCEIRSGKGSEMTFFRPGGRKCVLGCHKRNDAVSSVTVARLLKRLGIRFQEWLDAINM